MAWRFTRFWLLAIAFISVTPTVGSTQTAKVSEPAESGVQAIPVHGEWTIAVLRDGTPVERRDFPNALVVPDGAQLLRDLLTQKVNLHGWGIGLIDTNSSENLCVIGGEYFGDFASGASCFFLDWIDFFRGFQEGLNVSEIGELTVSTPSSGDHRLALVLSGTSTAVRDGSIGEVVSFVSLCRGEDCTPSLNPYANNIELVQFTRKDLSREPISVMADDEIRVTVILSFIAPSVELRAPPPQTPTHDFEAPSSPSPTGGSDG